MTAEVGAARHSLSVADLATWVRRSAALIAEHAELGSKVVVLTGAMQPAVMAHSDAGFNLGAAISALNLLEPGVYISMSGRIFPAHTVRKDRARGIFEG